MGITLSILLRSSYVLKIYSFTFNYFCIPLAFLQKGLFNKTTDQFAEPFIEFVFWNRLMVNLKFG